MDDLTISRQINWMLGGLTERVSTIQGYPRRKNRNMQRILLLSAILFVGSFVKAQEFIQVSVGEGYTSQTYYSLATQAGVTISNDTWDLAFTTFGLQDAGISINEASGSIFGMPTPELELYATTASSLAEITAFDSSFVRIYNDESSWLSGAFNNDRSLMNPFDYGWGAYNPMTRTVEGAKVYVIKLRDGSYKKFMISSLLLTTYNLSYANLDGTDSQTVSFDKNAFTDGLAYFSFAENNTLDIGVGAFDFVFTRYITPVYDPTLGPDTLEYPVTGILLGPGIEAVKLTGVDTDEIYLENLPNTFSTNLDVIGYDWKSFDFEGAYVVADSTAYVIKATDGQFYKLVFIDFEGSSTGVATFELSRVGTFSSTSDRLKGVFNELSVYPNPVPAQGRLSVQLDLQESLDRIQLKLYNELGQEIWHQWESAQKGENLYQITLPAHATPMNILSIQHDKGVLSQAIWLNK